MSPDSNKVAYIAGEQPVDVQVLDFIAGLGIPTIAEPDPWVDWILTVRQGALVLLDRRHPKFKPVSVNLAEMRRRYKSLPIPKTGPLAQALGKSTRTLIDATAGYGFDMFLMCLMGYKVVALERSAVIGALLNDGLHRVRELEPLALSVQLVVTDAIEYLQHAQVDCVYLDPMFPPRRKASALAKRPLRVLRTLVGDDDDRDRLFEAARAASCRRVVIKRPNYAKPWRAPEQTFSGKLMSYDLYLKLG